MKYFISTSIVAISFHREEGCLGIRKCCYVLQGLGILDSFVLTGYLISLSYLLSRGAMSLFGIGLAETERILFTLPRE